MTLAWKVLGRQEEGWRPDDEGAGPWVGWGTTARTTPSQRPKNRRPKGHTGATSDPFQIREPYFDVYRVGLR